METMDKAAAVAKLKEGGLKKTAALIEVVDEELLIEAFDECAEMPQAGVEVFFGFGTSLRQKYYD
jgi:hypothetical protein